MDKKIKVVLLCHISNSDIQDNLKLKLNFSEVIACILHKKSFDVKKSIGENNNFIWKAIQEYEKNTDAIELHVVSPHLCLCGKEQSFERNGIFYHFFKDENQDFSFRLRKIINKKAVFSKFLKNRGYAKKIINTISPDLVYLAGAENPFYSLCALDLPKEMPLLVHLHTLMNDPEFEKNYPISHYNYIYRAGIEKEILLRADFICTNVHKFIDIIRKDIKPNAKILNARLAVGVDVVINKDIKKDFDFVYFSANIAKAFDLALEGFACAQKQYNEITLHVVGSYDQAYKELIGKRISELGLTDKISFTGRLPTHDDVLNEIQKARFALLPLKIDITSGTIREALACEIPVITTITENGTPRLNENRETVLLSEIGNHQALADNMLKLLNDNNLAKKLIENGKILMKERYSNSAAGISQIKCIKAAFENMRYSKVIPVELCL